MKSKIPSVTLGLDPGGQETRHPRSQHARLPVSIRSHDPGCRQRCLGPAAPNPAKLSQLDRNWISSLNPLRGLRSSRPPREAGGISAGLERTPTIYLIQPAPMQKT